LLTAGQDTSLICDLDTGLLLNGLTKIEAQLEARMNLVTKNIAQKISTISMVSAAGMFAMVVGSTASAADLKIGYIDMQKAIQESSTGKDAKKKLEREFNAKKSELEKKKTEIEKMAEDLEKKKVALSDDVRARKAQDIQGEMVKFQQEAMKSEQEFRRKEQEMTKPIIEKLQSAIDEVAKEKGYAMIIERGTAQQVVIWAKKELDVTDDVIKLYEKKSK
jgi:outer membrane protein